MKKKKKLKKKAKNKSKSFLHSFLFRHLQNLFKSACLPACLPGWLAGWLAACLFACLSHALARKLKLLTFYRNWKIRLVFTESRHHGWRQENIFGTTSKTLENAVQGRNYFRACHNEHTQITTEKCFFLCLS